MSYKAHMHGGGKSSDCIVPTKCANKGGGPSAERMEGRRSAEETSRHGPMLDTEPENIGALQCRGNACSRYRLGAERSEVGTACVGSASTGLCGAAGNRRPCRGPHSVFKSVAVSLAAQQLG